jgi:hypothetical protein
MVMFALISMLVMKLSIEAGNSVSDRIRRLTRCNTRCTLPVVLPVFEPLLFRGIGFMQQPRYVS